MTSSRRSRGVRLPLDTGAFLWHISGDPRLPGHVDQNGNRLVPSEARFSFDRIWICGRRLTKTS